MVGLSGRKRANGKNRIVYYVPGDLREAIGGIGKPATINEAMTRANEDAAGGSELFENNCYNVVVAYELQRRGYDVKALPHNAELNLGEMIYPEGEAKGYMVSRWTGAFRHAKFDYVGDQDLKTAVVKLKDKIKSYGDGARGAVQFDWADYDGGHVLNFENRHGRVLLVDAQDKKQYSVHEILEHAKTHTVNVVRIDNLKISDRAKNSIRTR